MSTPLGLPTMRSTSLALVALVALIGSLWFFTHADRAAAPGAALTGAAPPTVGDPSTAELAAPPRPAEPTRAEAASAAVNDAVPPEATSPGECVLLGRFVDVDRRPVVDAEVRLSAYQVWAAGHDVPRVDERIDLRGFVTRTDEAGAFRLAVPPPTAPRQRLEVWPGPFVDSFSTFFGADSRERRPALAAGTTDLGDVVLATTGSVSGRVLDERGAPVVDAEVDLGPSRSTTYSRDARTRADGTFLVAHAPVGTYGVTVKATGFVSVFVTPVTVEARRETTGIDATLVVAESIQGTVRNEQGAPLAGVRLWGWPKSSGSGAGAKSDADGRFTVFLPQSEPYSLEATLDGHAPWGGDRERVFEPGTRDLEIVLQAMERLQVTVVDNTTGTPLTRFGVDVLEDNGSRAERRVHTERRRPADKDHPDGVALVTARSGVDLLVAAAEGYLLTTLDAELGEASPPTQVIRLRRAPVVRGRAWRDGVPLADAAVELVGGRFDAPRVRTQHPTTTEEALAFFEAERSRPRWFRPERNGARTTRTDAEGRFALAPERPGELRLSIEAGPGWSLVRAPLQAGTDGDLDLGDVHADMSGGVDGTVLVPAGVSPAGLEVRLDDWTEDVLALVDAAGRFRFEDLAPGHHLLTLGERPGILEGSAGVMCEVRSGEPTPVTLDARDRGITELVLTFAATGADVRGLRVMVPDPNETFGTSPLGTIGEDGVVRGSVRAFGTAVVKFWELGISLTDQPIELVAFERVERTLRVALGRIELRWPAGVALPEGALVQFALEPPLESRRDGAPTQSGALNLGASDASSKWFRADHTGASLDHVVAGRSRLKVTVTDPKERTETKLPNGGTSYAARVLLDTTVEVEVAPGQLTTVQL